MVYLVVKTMVAALKGETVLKRIDTGATVVDKQSMNNPDMAQLLHPPQK
jgi:ribose transport system substrate-binding protein